MAAQRWQKADAALKVAGGERGRLLALHQAAETQRRKTAKQARIRLVEIIHNLTDRISEARVNGWLGGAQGLQVSLTKAKEKLTSLDRGSSRTHYGGGPVQLGMPVITQ